MRLNHLLVLGTTSLLLFAAVALLVFGNITQAFDARLALLLNSDQGSAVTTLMVQATLYGRETFWIPIVAVMLLLGKRDTKLLAIELAVLFLIGIAAGDLLKYVAYRPRPIYTISVVARVAFETDSSFPSGHALITSIGAVFALLKFRNKIVSLLLTLEAAVVCYSRVYVGMHYPLDVVAGVLLGTAIVSLGLVILESAAVRRSRRLASPLGRLLRLSHLPQVL